MSCLHPSSLKQDGQLILWRHGDGTKVDSLLLAGDPEKRQSTVLRIAYSATHGIVAVARTHYTHVDIVRVDESKLQLLAPISVQGQPWSVAFDSSSRLWFVIPAAH